MANYYKIVALNASIGQMQVKYWTDQFSDGLIYSVDLPVDANNQIPTGQALDDLIMSFFPTGQIQAIVDRQTLIAKVDLSSVKALVQPLAPVTTTTQAQPTTTGTQTISATTAA
jgi:hypothetical protein